MTLLQTKIRNCFNRASASYDNVACIQRQSAEFLVKKLLEGSHFVPKNILDLGTGTGYVPELLIKSYPNSSYLLNDIAPKMLEVCRLKFADHGNFEFSNGNMEASDFPNHDLIVSNLALQWVNDLQNVLKKFHDKSQVFAFSTLLKGTFEEWQNILSNYDMTSPVKDYPSKEELIDFCMDIKNSDFYYWSKDFQMTFENNLDFMNYLKNLGARTSDQTLHFSALRSLVKDNDKELVITYKIFFGILK